MSNALVMTCAAAAWTATCLLIADALYGRQRRVERRIRQVAGGSGVASETASSLFRGWNLADTHSTSPVARIREYVQQSGLPVAARHVAAAMACLAVTAASLAWLLDRHWSLSCIAGAAGLAAPCLFVWYARHRRILQVTRQLPEAFDIMRRAVQAGQTVPSAMQLAATECRRPLAQELALCCDQQNLGLPFDATLRDLAIRIPITEVQIFAIAMMVQRQFGSNPVEILSNISDMIRKRARLAKRVQALTGEGRLQAIVLTILPIAVFVWLLVFRPEYVQSLLERPRLLGAVAALQIVGTIWIRRTIRIEY